MNQAEHLITLIRLRELRKKYEHMAFHNDETTNRIASIIENTINDIAKILQNERVSQD